jgi:hypothetical protein
MTDISPKSDGCLAPSRTCEHYFKYDRIDIDVPLRTVYRTVADPFEGLLHRRVASRAHFHFIADAPYQQHGMVFVFVNGHPSGLNLLVDLRPVMVAKLRRLVGQPTADGYRQAKLADFIKFVHDSLSTTIR